MVRMVSLSTDFADPYFFLGEPMTMKVILTLGLAVIIMLLQLI